MILSHIYSVFCLSLAVFGASSFPPPSENRGDLRFFLHLGAVIPIFFTDVFFSFTRMFAWLLSLAAPFHLGRSPLWKPVFFFFFCRRSRSILFFSTFFFLSRERVRTQPNKSTVQFSPLFFLDPVRVFLKKPPSKFAFCTREVSAVLTRVMIQGPYAFILLLSSFRAPLAVLIRKLDSAQRRRNNRPSLLMCIQFSPPTVRCHDDDRGFPPRLSIHSVPFFPLEKDLFYYPFLPFEVNLTSDEERPMKVI